MQYQVIKLDGCGDIIMHLLRPRYPTTEQQNEIERWRRDSFKFGGKYVGFDLYFKTAEQVEQFLIWQGLQV